MFALRKINTEKNKHIKLEVKHENEAKKNLMNFSLLILNDGLKSTFIQTVFLHYVVETPFFFLFL